MITCLLSNPELRCMSVAVDLHDVIFKPIPLQRVQMMTEPFFQSCILEHYNAVFIHSTDRDLTGKVCAGPVAAVCFQNSVTAMERGCSAEQHTTLFRP